MADKETPSKEEADIAPLAALPIPNPVASSRCVSTESAASIVSLRSRLNRVRYVLLIDQAKKEAVLQRCACPRCAGVLRFRRRVEEESSDDKYWGVYDEDEGLTNEYDAPGSLRGVTDEELYEMQAMSKATRRSGTSTARTKPQKKKKAQKEAAKKDSTSTTVKRREANRAEEHKAQIEARKQNVEKRVGKHRRRGLLETSLSPLASPPPVLWRSSTSNQNKSSQPASSATVNLQTPAGETILSAQQLGMDATPEGRQNYDRLLQIMRGDDINPNDFDLLLSLDETVQKPTLQLSQVEEFPILTLNDIETTKQNGMCLICLQPFTEMKEDAQLRKLPCAHMYCKDCIDQWLTETSHKCPDLSCFWAVGDSDDDRPTTVTNTDNSTAAAAAPATNNNNNNLPDFNETNAITSELLQSASTDLWSFSDLESSLHKPEEEGGLSTDTVLEKISDASLAIQHFETIVELQKIYDRLDDGATDEDIYDDIIELYSIFLGFMDENNVVVGSD